MASICDLFGNNQKPMRIPTSSGHIKIVNEAINDTIKKRPYLKEFVLALALYPLHKWSAIQRKKLELDLINLAEGDETYSYFGINNIPMSQKNILILNDLSLAFFEKVLDSSIEGVNYEVISCAHTLGNDKCSQYLFSLYYKKSLLILAEAFYEDYKPISAKYKNEFLKIKEDIRFVYHESDLLIKLRQNIKSIEENPSYRDSMDIDYGEVLNNIDKLLHSLKGYPLDGDEIYKITSLYAKGTSEKDIVIITGKSRTYIKAKYEEGKRLISYILWGYSAKDILRQGVLR